MYLFVLYFLIQSTIGFIIKKHTNSIIIRQYNKKPDFIDVEIVNEDGSNKDTNIKKREEIDDKPIPGINGITNLLKQGVNSITKIFEKEKDQKLNNQKKEMNQAIDKIMQGIIIHKYLLHYDLLCPLARHWCWWINTGIIDERCRFYVS